VPVKSACLQHFIKRIACENISFDINWQIPYACPAPDRWFSWIKHTRPFFVVIRPQRPNTSASRPCETDCIATGPISKRRACGYDPCRRVHQILNDLAKSAEFHLPTGTYPLSIATCPHNRSILNANTESVSTNAFVENFPLGRRSSAISLFISEWNCSLVPWSWYAATTSLALASCLLRLVHHVFYFDQRQQQCVAIPINRPFNHLEHNAHGLAIPLAHRIANVLYTVFPSRENSIDRMVLGQYSTIISIIHLKYYY